CLDEQVNLMIDKVLQGSPDALRLTKRFLDELRPRALDDALDRALALHVEVRKSPDAQEGMRAFTEKRPPRWQD
ncbi:MAG: hypothetical protein RLZZ303_1359, partial [Candidatus Hydrogenedentota bacterium]